MSIESNPVRYIHVHAPELRSDHPTFIFLLIPESAHQKRLTITSLQKFPYLNYHISPITKWKTFYLSYNAVIYVSLLRFWPISAGFLTDPPWISIFWNDIKMLTRCEKKIETLIILQSHINSKNLISNDFIQEHGLWLQIK